MKKRTILLFLLITFLLSSGTATAQTDRTGAQPGYHLEQIQPGSGYTVSGASWQFVGEAGSDSYQLVSRPGGSADAGCCCLYFPCIKRK